MKSKACHLLSFCSVLSPIPVGTALAAQSAVLDEITVTATRRAENVQDVPISIVAVTGESLVLQGVTSVQNLNGSIPNLVIVGGLGGSGGVGGSNFAVRGIPRVGLYIDGIWQASNQAMIDYNFVDLDRLEVLRGPQGTLYGRDSTGGAIRIVTKTPAKEFGAEGNVTIGNYDRRDVTLAADIPLGDTLSTRWTAAQLKRDGYVHSVTTNDDLGQIDQTFLRGAVRWEPTDRFSAQLSYQTSESHPTDAKIVNGYFPQIARISGLSAGITELYTLAGAPYTSVSQVAGYPGGELGDLESRQNTTKPAKFERDQASLNMTYSFTDNLNLESWTAYTEQNWKEWADWDTSQYDLFVDVNHGKFKLFSQEFQLSGVNGRFDWVAGLYYWNQAQTYRQTRWGGTEFRTGELSMVPVLASPQCVVPQAPLNCQQSLDVYIGTPAQQAQGNFGALGTDALTRSKEDGYAVFGEVAFSITERMKLTLGARYHEQDIEVTPLRITPGLTATRSRLEVAELTGGDPLAGVPITTDSTSFNKVTTRAVLSRNFTDDIMAYASYSQGFNSGGFSAINFSCSRLVIPYDPETLNTYELGFRSDLANGRVRLNVTGFFTDWKDIQLGGDVIDPCTGRLALSPATQNVASAEAKGVEVEFTLAATDSIQFNANLGLLDTAYTAVIPGNTQVGTNSDFAQAPKESYSLGVQHTGRFGNGAQLVSRVDYSYVGGYQRYRVPSYHPVNWGLGDGFDGGDYGLVNARVAYSSLDRKWEVAAFGTNLTDERYLTSGILHGLWQTDWGNLGRPREYGVELKFFLK